MPFKLFGFFFLVILSPAAHAQSLEFKDHGKLVRKLEIAEIESLVHSKEVKVIEPHDQSQRVYQGWAVTDLLKAVYGKKWKSAQDILFTCTDGYQPSIPVSRFGQHKAYLVFKRDDVADFSVENKNEGGQKVTLAPFYLIWDNLHDPYIKAMGPHDWPYQLTTFDLIQFSERFPKMDPGERASTSVKRGFAYFREFCITCHKIEGEGGTKAMDLILPTPVIENRSDEWLANWIRDPHKINPVSQMPAMNPGVPKLNKVIADIIAFLKAKSKHAKTAEVTDGSRG